MFGLTEVRRCQSRGEARQLGLVLTAQGIPSKIIPMGDRVALCVRNGDLDAAEYELQQYEAENAPPMRQQATLPWRPKGGGLETAFAYITLIVFVFAASNRGAFGWDWSAWGAVDAAAIRDGAWWRTITALTLHADLEHLLSNIAFGSVAGALVVQTLGPGIGWLAILLSGAFGNAVNALILQGGDHFSVGASTAVFGALGLLSGHTQDRSIKTNPLRQGLRRLAPAGAGILLLAFLGFGGENTDIGAHIAGFGVGLGLGLGLGQIPQHFQRGGWQIASGVLTVALIAVAWLMAR